MICRMTHVSALALWLMGAGFAQADCSRDLEAKTWNSETRHYEQLEKDIARIIQLEPNSACGHALMSHLLTRIFAENPADMGVLKQASELAEQAVHLAPDRDYGYVALADVLDLMGQSSKAIKFLEDSEKFVTAASWRFTFMQARLHSEDESSKMSVDLFRKSLASKDAYTEIIVPYVVALEQTKHQGTELVATLSRWQHDFPSPYFRQSIGSTLVELGMYPQAHKIYSDMLKDKVLVSETSINDAIILYKNLHHPREAIAQFENTLKNSTVEFDANQMATIYAHLGSAYVEAKDFAKARAIFVKAFQHSPGNLALYGFVSKEYRSVKNSFELVQMLKELNREWKGVGLAYALMGEVFAEDLRQYPNAIKAYSNAITLDPDRSDFYTGLGLTYYRMKDLKHALEHFQQASRIDPNDATARYNTACVLAKTGKNDEAMEVLQDALALDPGLAVGATRDEDFAAIRNSPRFQEVVTTSVNADTEPAH